ncbi:thioesterase domain-containing protein [Kitasatospora sp. NPDC058170]|uniref:thioesterase domain-containing protein n=1 Tax=Kitasatospora sp. NPDC058170 TaxID=3346364 RepID=UPI0036D7619A
MWSPASECLVPLQVSGTGRAVYCVHALGGTVAYYAPVARRLGHLRDVYGLQCHGISPANPADRTIEDMAARYIRAVTAVQPEGPYEILGYSMGGFIAFEMARQWEARGERVALVGLLDTDPPHTQQDPLSTGQALGLLSRAVGLSTPFTAPDGAPHDELLDGFLRRAVAERRLPVSFRAEDLKPLVDIYGINGNACARYDPDAVFGSIDCLFTHRPGSTPAGLAEGWQDYVDGEVRAEAVDADHHALMHEQHAAQVSAVILRWLTRETT